ncbi:MAG TPA: transglycosylase SLT domain-containing protein [Oligoflexus sp.]|uniref:lytic transglycosylase domain-containing protein n=1 Tax=Oligoflexus sp. TaxID=1971216 RepID=UPI002D543A12|nr:transglycosylase SLT domain-containing protein [Oligoflexus sp.]HYX32914.1 transglycosylase SLT domain-containing protein [Oligoflexus sp.]
MFELNLKACRRAATHRFIVCLFLAFGYFLSPALQAQGQPDTRKMEPCEIKFVQKIKDAEIHHILCPEPSVEDIPLTGDFSIPPSLFARVRFWHQVFVQLSVKDYVIHVSDHPHIVLEVVRFPWLNALGTIDSRARNILKARQRHYKEIFRRMDQGKTLASEHIEAARLSTALKAIPGKSRMATLDLRNQKGQRELMHKGLENSSLYLTHIEQEFKTRSIPPELGLLAFVESTFNIKAVSKVKASGVYQIMPFIARQYMKLTAAIDERRDPIKSAAVAAQILKFNYELLGSWPLAITAYNHGPYGIKQAVKKAQSSDIAVLIDSYNGRGFGFASQNFYAEFLAILYALKHADKHFPDAKILASLNFRNETLDRPMRIRDLSKRFGVSVESLHALNPDLSLSLIRQNGLIPRNFTIKIPLLANGFSQAR